MLLQNHQLVINEYSIHRVVLITYLCSFKLMCRVMSAAKFYDDSFYNNEIYSRIGGVSVDELNKLEVDFMLLINFSLIISQKEFLRIYYELYTHCSSICTSCSRYLKRM